MHWLYLLIAIVAEVIATTSLKPAEGFTRLGPSLIVIAGYAVAFFFLSLTLKTIPVGVAYAIWSGLGVALVVGLSWWLYGQSFDHAGLIGVGLIISGVVVLNLFSNVSGH